MKIMIHWQASIRIFAMTSMVVSLLLGLELSKPNSLGADSGVVEMGFADGKVDWTSGVVRAVGLGIPSQKAKNAAHAKATARRAARIVAYRNLLEIVEGIQVDSHSLVKEFMLESDVIKTKVQGIVRGARVTDEKSLPDGLYEVTVEMKMAGSLQKTVLPPREKEPEPLDFVESSSSTNISGTPEIAMVDSAAPAEVPTSTEIVVYTGLIIDAQGLDVQQTMAPKLIMEDGRVVYGSEWIDPEVSRQRTVVGYIKGIPNAKTHERVIAEPLVVKALRVDANNPSDLVISDADAQMLHLIPEHVAFLRKAKVIVVLE